MNGCVFLCEIMLYTACRTALLLRTSNVYTCKTYQAMRLVENTSRECDWSEFVWSTVAVEKEAEKEEEGEDEKGGGG